jgi:hypothetical protein
MTNEFIIAIMENLNEILREEVENGKNSTQRKFS